MREFDKKANLKKVNLLSEERYIESKELLNENSEYNYIKNLGLRLGQGSFEGWVTPKIATPEQIKLLAKFIKIGVDLAVEEELNFMIKNPDYYKNF
jgi:hypothetical protein